MDYTHLTTNDLDGLRRERIVTLEGEHYRLALLMAEVTTADEAAVLLTRQAELERRITLHSGRPSTEEPEQANDCDRERSKP